MMSDWEKRLLEILTTEETGLKTYAKIARADPRYFYQNADFKGADLSDEDLYGIDLSHASNFTHTEKNDSKNEKDQWISLEVHIAATIADLCVMRSSYGQVPFVDRALCLFEEDYSWKNPWTKFGSSLDLENLVLRKLMFISPRRERRRFQTRIRFSTLESYKKRAEKRNVLFSEMIRYGISYCIAFDQDFVFSDALEKRMIENYRRD